MRGERKFTRCAALAASVVLLAAAGCAPPASADCGPLFSPAGPNAEALGAAQGSGVKFFTIGSGAGAEEIDLTELQTLAAATGGTFANVDSADELDTLFEKVFNAIRASGVITLDISPTPPAGSLVTGTVEFTVTGRTFTLPYAVQL